MSYYRSGPSGYYSSGYPVHQYYSPTYNFGTVHDLLREAGRHRKDHRYPSGHDCDHVVELQLIKAAVNMVPVKNAQWLGNLIDYFQNDRNFQPLTHAQNEQKGAAIGRLIHDHQQQRGDGQWIQNVRNRWLDIRNGLMGASTQEFYQAMNQLLGA